MDVSRVPRRSVTAEIAALLDSPEIGQPIAELDALRWTGRKGYGARVLLGACLVIDDTAMKKCLHTAVRFIEWLDLETQARGLRKPQTPV
jgi:hypothetical protein